MTFAPIVWIILLSEIPARLNRGSNSAIYSFFSLLNGGPHLREKEFASLGRPHFRMVFSPLKANRKSQKFFPFA